MTTVARKLNSPPIKHYYRQLESAEAVDRKEGNVCRAFANLLKETARPHTLKLSEE